MDTYIISITTRVFITCSFFAFFVLTSLKSRLRYSWKNTILLVLFLIFLTIGVTVLFLTHNRYLCRYSTFGIIFWIVSAAVIFRLMIRGSGLELWFLVLILLNLYVNIMAIVKLIAQELGFVFPDDLRCVLILAAVLVLCFPLFWSLFWQRYRRIIEYNAGKSLWKFIWIIPALAYMIFYVKIIQDYWKTPEEIMAGDVVFILLWTFTTYVFFWVTMEMLIQAYKGVSAKEEMKYVTAQLRFQQEQYKKLFDSIETTARIRHDWHHHLSIMNGLAENGNMEKLHSYLRDLFPQYVTGREVAICENHVVDVILQHYFTLAKARKIRMIREVRIPDNIEVADTDLCILFGNLVENAMEACEGEGIIDPGERWIEIKAELQGKQLILLIKNTYGKAVVRDQDIYYSSKHEGAGIGLMSVRRMMERYQGQLKIEYDEHMFTVSVLINAESKSEK